MSFNASVVSTKENVNEKTAVFIVGMGKSGTSATTGVLYLLGLNLGERLIGPTPINEKGHFEDLDFLTINEKILLELNSSWKDAKPLILIGIVQKGWNIKIK